MALPQIKPRIRTDGLEALFGENSARFQVVDIRIADIDEFPNHPFPVLHDDALEKLKSDISIMGQLEPAIIRDMGGGRYQMLSGHRRMLALKELGLDTINAIVLDNLNDNQAEVIMLHCNDRRNELTLTQRAKIAGNQLDALNKMSKSDIRSLCSLFSPKLNYVTDKVSALSNLTGESVGTARRLLRFNGLIPEIKELVESGKLVYAVAADSVATKLGAEDQEVLAEFILKSNEKLSAEDISELSSISSDSGLDEKVIKHYLKEKKKELKPERPKKKSKQKNPLSAETINKEYVAFIDAILHKFPDGSSFEDITKIVLGLLDEWELSRTDI